MFYLHGFTDNFSGNSADWVKLNLNIPIVSTIYLKYNEEYYHREYQIGPLSRELETIVKEILTISKEIYRPLFNNQIKQKPALNKIGLVLILLLIKL